MIGMDAVGGEAKVCKMLIPGMNPYSP